MKICMLPMTSNLGIGRVVEAYRKHLPKFGVDFVTDEEHADLIICHAGVRAKARQTDVLICHGLYPTATVDKATQFYETNAQVVQNAREALQITVPSEWVALPFKRDMGISPHVVPHGIELSDWKPQPTGNFVIWAKGHNPGVCDATVVNDLAAMLPNTQFVSTFGKPTANVRITGSVSFPEMKKLLPKASVYLATTKETFGIQTLEAMACGIPVVGYRHGATPDIVTHGVDGWLVEPGDLVGLSQGLEWAMVNRNTLGQAAREHASKFTWEAACEKLYNVLKIAAEPRKSTLVSVIIPCYNYGKWVGEAIDSVLGQTYNDPVEIIVVDDGSVDNTEQAVQPYLGKVSYYKKANGGVAEARNYGIRHSSGDLIACLDADDRWDKDFLSKLVPPMLSDRSLGLVYGHLISDNGSGQYRSAWPPDFDFHQQSTRHNSVPSSCLFRRSAWRRAGGYKAQYTPAEDAELWLSIAAAGYNVRKVTQDVVYTYRLHSNSLSRKIKEPDWVDDKPYSKDAELTPFAAPTSGSLSSHPFKDYDDPWVSVIIPVGPGHENLAHRAVRSLTSQSLQNWEVIVVNDSGNQLTYPNTGTLLRDQYPFITELTSGRGGLGVAWARNQGAKVAKSGLLVFLDADDWLLPGFLANVVQAFNDNPCNYIYTDWLGYDGKDTTIRLSKEFTTAGIFKEALHPITTLVPKTWHDEIGGFDETLSGWEDWVYYLDLVKNGHCGYRVGVQGLVYDYSSGTRREDSLKKRNELLPIIRKRYNKETIMACATCGGSRGRARATVPALPVPTASPMIKGVPIMAAKSVDGTDKMVSVRENSGNAGSHGVVGVRTRINYGRRKHGDIFTMHIDDATAQPQRYVRVVEVQAPDPRPVKPEIAIPAVSTPMAQSVVVDPKHSKPVMEERAAAPVTVAEIIEQASQPIADDEIEVDITILPLTQIKQLDLDAEDAAAALELEKSSKKPRASVITYLESLAG